MLQTCSKDKPGSQEHGCPGGRGGLVCLNLGVRAGRGQLGIRVSVLGPQRGASLH